MRSFGFQSTSPVWGMTIKEMERVSTTAISIHIPRVGDDEIRTSPRAGDGISIHIPRVGDDLPKLSKPWLRWIFQSTSPVWGMTRWMKPRTKPATFQSTSPVWGMTIPQIDRDASLIISIHIPRVGDDVAERAISSGRRLFQSTSPVWGMTCGGGGRSLDTRDFNPHPPCGG